MRRLLLVALCVAGAVSLVTPAAAQKPAGGEVADPRAGQNTRSGQLPVSLDRIRRELDRPGPTDVLRLPETPTFTVVVEERLPLLREFFGGDAWTFGPAPATGMSHRDFLDLVTPKHVRPYASSVNGDLLQVLATSMATAYAMQSGANVVRSWLKARREAEAKREVEETLRQIEEQKKQVDGQTPKPSTSPPK